MKLAPNVHSLVLAATVALATTGCAIPKILVDDAFLGGQRTMKVVIRQNTAGLYDEFMRICAVDASARESGCQETLILSNVAPQ